LVRRHRGQILLPPFRWPGASAFIALVGAPDALVEAGYLGEGIVLEATRLGLATCWVAGTYDRENASEHVVLHREEELLAIIPVGYAVTDARHRDRLMRSMIRADSRKPLEIIAAGSETWPDWARESASAVRLAPSGANGQPWRLRLEDDALIIARASRKAYWTHPMDCGIAMMHAAIGAQHAEVTGSWKRLSDPDVARFTLR